MLPLNDLDSSEIRALGRRALDLAARRFDDMARAAKADDLPLRDLLRKMMLDTETQADEVGPRGEAEPGRDTLLLNVHLKSLTKSLGDGPLHRDIALFLAESIEEELSRFFIALAEHAREWSFSRLLHELADREQQNLRFLRGVVLQG